MSESIVVTGANGFVGSCMVEALFAAGGFAIVPTSRRAHAGGRVARFGCALRPADLADPAAVDMLVKGANAVVHCAYGGDTDHVAATRTLLDAVVAAGVGTFVHISTTEVYATHAGTIDESAPLRAHGADYGALKARIDELVRTYADKIPRLVILRPGIIYGPLSDAWTIGPIRRLLAGWRPAEELRGLGNFVHIADLCAIGVNVLREPPAPGLRVYNVVGPEVISWINYFESLAAAIGVQLPAHGPSAGTKAQLGFVRSMLKILPTGLRRNLVKSVSALRIGNRLVGRWRVMHQNEPISAEKELYTRDVHYSIERLVKDGYGPRVGIAEGIKQSAAWARQVGLL